jgi:hypothetical protein
VISVPVAVNRYLMPTGDDLLEPVWSVLYLLPDDEEGSLGLSLLQQPEEAIQSPIRPVVEG